MSIFLVSYSLLGSITVLAEEKAPGNIFKAVATKDFEILSEGKKQGDIVEESIFYVSVDNNQYFIQWGENRVAITPDSFQFVSEINDQDYAEPPVPTQSYLSSTQLIEVLNQENKKMATIEPGVDFPIFSEEATSIRIIIGNQIVKVEHSTFLTVKSATEVHNVNGDLEEETLNDESSQSGTEQNQENDAAEQQQSDSNLISEDTVVSSDIPENEEQVQDLKEEEASATQIQTSTATRQATIEFTAADKFFQVSVDSLGVYDNSSGSLVKVGELIKGQIYPRVSEYGNWHQIRFGNKLAYVYEGSTVPASGSGLKNIDTGAANSSININAIENVTVYDNTSGSLVPFAVIQSKQSYPVISEYGNWYKISIAGRIGYIHKSLTSLPFKATDKYFKVLVDKLPIYANKSGNLVEVGSLEKGQEFPRTDYGNWHQIKFGNGYAYVLKSSTGPSTGSSIKNLNGSTSTATLFKGIEQLPVYDNTSGELVKFATINSNINYPIISEFGNWVKIDIGGRAGYVYKGLTRIPFKDSDRYFRVMEENVKFYDNSSGSLVEAGTLVYGQVYSRVADYGNWHKIQVGDRYGYVWENSTNPDSGVSVKNFASILNVSPKTLRTLDTAVVFDNSSGTLVPFASILPNVNMSYIGTLGNWYKVNVSGRIGYIYKTSVQSGYLIASPTLEVYSSYEDLSNYSRQDGVATLSFGQSVDIISENQYAAQIRTLDGKITGWVQKDYLDNDLSNNWWYVKEARAIRSEATSASAQIGSLGEKSSVKLLGYSIGTDPTYKGWYKVQTESGATGWIWGNSGNGLNIIRYEKEKMGAETNTISIFTPLNTLANATATQINGFIHYMTNGNTTSYMYNMGDAYLEAQRLTGVNAIYLLSHSALETGFGTSSIVQTKYNYFGIAAFDACPSECASTFDGKRGGIIEGAKWISNNYINRDAYQQITLDNMRNNGEKHQYATDEAWHVKIASIADKFVSFLKSL